MQKNIPLGAVSGMLVLAGPAWAQHGTDVWLGRTSSGQLVLSPDGLVPGSVYHPLTPVDTFLHGWSDNDPGFDHVFASQPQYGILPLQAGAEIWLEVVSLEAPLLIIDNAFQILEFPGHATDLGGAGLHEHLTWFIDADDPRLDDDQCVWEATLILRDAGSTHYQRTLPFTLLLTNVPVRGGGFPPLPIQADGDFDGDGATDLFDTSALVVCLSAPGVRPNPGYPTITNCEVECHNAFDFDDDMDVDLFDYAEFQVRLGQ